MWVYTFFPSEVGVFPHKCCLDGRGRKVRELCLPLPQAHGRRDAAESLVLCGDPTRRLVVVGVRELLIMQQDRDRRWLTLLGRSRAVASVHCQTYHESLCQRMAMEELGTALNGLPGVCSSVCRYGVGFASQILGSFLHWPQPLCCECAHCTSLAGSMLALLRPF